MTEPRLRHVQCLSATGLHRMAYWEWGDAHNPHVVVCVHGLSRQGRDFDELAQDLAQNCRVICPDVVGRGQSDWLDNPMAYGIPTYLADMVTLLARLDVVQIDWVGTSMGGLIGMALAAQVVRGNGRSPVRRLLLNDVGPVIEPVFMQRLGQYLGQPMHWKTVDEAAEALRLISLGFGPHTREQWLALTRPQLVPHVQDGVAGFKSHYDPAIAVPVRAMTPEIAAAGQAALWHLYDQIRCPTLLLRGELSDLLSPATAHAMTERGPKAQLQQVDGVGHAPTLVQPDQRARVRAFLLGP
jgi:pimeloyl-ACP methyl ester carboxylesterase